MKNQILFITFCFTKDATKAVEIQDSEGHPHPPKMPLTKCLKPPNPLTDGFDNQRGMFFKFNISGRAARLSSCKINEKIEKIFDSGHTCIIATIVKRTKTGLNHLLIQALPDLRHPLANIRPSTCKTNRYSESSIQRKNRSPNF